MLSFQVMWFLKFIFKDKLTDPSTDGLHYFITDRRYFSYNLEKVTNSSVKLYDIPSFLRAYINF